MLMTRTRRTARSSLEYKDESHSSSTALPPDGIRTKCLNNEHIQNSLGAIRNVRQMRNEDDREYGSLLCFLINIVLFYHDLRFNEIPFSCPSDIKRNELLNDTMKTI